MLINWLIRSRSGEKSFSVTVFTLLIFQFSHNFSEEFPAGCTERKISLCIHHDGHRKKSQRITPLWSDHMHPSAIFSCCWKEQTPAFESFVCTIYCMPLYLNKNHIGYLRRAPRLSLPNETAAASHKVFICQVFIWQWEWSQGTVGGSFCWVHWGIDYPARCCSGMCHMLCRILIKLFACPSRCWGNLI